ncbi:DUF1361 domain-containing protein [candidate division WOR-3 bacterium]|nr:DUF1361 domain-containing protein [candidate division WOR-3 bacterium]
MKSLKHVTGQNLGRYKYTIISFSALYALSILGCAMIFVRRLYTGRYFFLYLVWNLFLAWAPLLFSVLINAASYLRFKKLKIVLMPFFGFVWLLFFPNAPYMVTDFIHFRNSGTFLVWYDLVIYLIFILTGFFIGFVSLYIVKKTIDQIFNQYASFVCMFIAMFLGSYAIYIGRFVRHNSWDAILNPFGIIMSFLSNINIQSVVFSAIFSALLTLIYTFLYGLTHLEHEIKG